MIKISKKNKKGLTLLEIMLAVAIMAITASVFFSLILVVMKSHSNVIATNDMADYAMLCGRAFENTIINAKEVGSGSKSIYVNVDNKLSKNSVALFNLEQYKVIPGDKDKWDVDFKASIGDDGVVKYKVILTDQSTSAVAGINHYTYVYEGSVYCGRAQKITPQAEAEHIEFEEW
ncbi:MAG: type II secretion system protein [Clostridiales bacterium]|nr:type II secretion system protein [Clostridiales bacterium]